MSDNKIMAEKSNAVNPTIEAAKETSTPVTPGDFHEFTGSQTKQYGETYSSRQEKIASFLGCKDSQKS